jgi:iron complex outermembrane receptor protein
MQARKHSNAQLNPIPLALIALLGSTSVWAQTAPASNAESAYVLETVIVKSQRRDEKLQDVPVVVKAFTAKQIEDSGIKSTQDFVNMTPNVSFDQSYTYSNSYLVIRGVSQLNNGDSPVAVVVDGVPQNDQKQMKMNLFDIQSIEVLKGPQGALYGRNAIGGALVIESKKPKNQLEGFVKADFSSGNTREMGAGVSGALVPDKVMFRLVGQTKSSDGIIKNVFLNKGADNIDHDNSVRARITVAASDSVNLDFRASSQDYRGGATSDSILRDGNPNKIVAPDMNLMGVTWGYTNDFSFKAEVDTRLGLLTAISGYTDLSEKYRGDLDFTNPKNALGGILGPVDYLFPGSPGQFGQGQDRHVKTFTQEIRLTSPSKQRLRWIGGLFYLDSQRDMANRAFIDFTGSLAGYDNLAVLLGPPSHDQHKGRASAVFGQFDYDINPQTTFSGALRYDTDRRSMTDLNSGSSVAKTFSSTQPKFTLTTHLDPSNMVYGTFATGFRSGLFNSTTSSSPMVKAETLQNFEVGYKSSFLDKRLILNMAVFNSKSKDFQFFYVKNFQQIIANIDKVDIKGLDVDFRFAPARGLEFDGGLGLTDSIIKANAAQPTTVGKHTPKNSPWKVTLGAQYTAPIGNGLMGFGRFDMEQRSQKYWHPDNIAVSDGFSLYNLRVGIRQEKDKWSVNLYGRNLGDKKYYSDVNASAYAGWPGQVGAIGHLTQGRSVGVDATFKF